MKHLHLLIILLLCLPLTAGAQKKKGTAKKAKPQTESRTVRKLRDERSNVQNELKANERKLRTNKKDTETKQKHVAYIEQQLDERVAYIHRLEHSIDSIDKIMTQLTGELDKANRSLKEKKLRYGEGLRYARTQQLKGGNISVVWFTLQADTWQQMYRRARYAREYTSHQEILGRQIMAQQEEIRKKQSKLLKYKNEMNTLLGDISNQRRLLMEERRTEQQLLGGLRTQQKALTTEIERQRRHLVELDNKIEQVIAHEIEMARKRAEEAARQEAERQRLAEAGKTPSASNSSASSKTTASSTSTTSSKSSTSSTSSGKSIGEVFTTTADRALSGSFERNKGKLPVPISGPYRIGTRKGTVQVMKNVQLENKGTNFIGKNGAFARAIFDGEVTAVFAYGGMTNVLVRHGSYISVYCNLSSVRVRQGQKVKTRDLLGAVALDEQGETTLMFQLRREKACLNPEAWIAK